MIHAGDAEVTGDGSAIETMGPGDGFGEIALLRGTPRTATVRARTDLELFALERRHFVQAVTGYPSSSSEASGLMRARLGRASGSRAAVLTPATT